jgi:hypothetical protein
MKRRSKVKATAAKARSSKSARLKRESARNGTTGMAGPATGERSEIAQLARELNEARGQLQRLTTDLTESLERQTATSEVLQVISSSPSELEPVFATMLERAVHICDATFGTIYRWEGDALRVIALLLQRRAEDRRIIVIRLIGLSLACLQRKRPFK